MRLYKELYVQEELINKKDKVISKLKNGKLQPTIHVITLASNPKNHLDIISSVLLLQPSYPKEDMVIIGLTKSYDAALEMVESILEEVYNATNGTDIRSYLINKEREGCND